MYLIIFKFYRIVINKKKIKIMELFNCSSLSNAKIPIRATEGSAGYDLFAYNEKLIPKHSVGRVCTGDDD